MTLHNQPIIFSRWKNIQEDGCEQWIGVFAGFVWKLKQHDDHLCYQVFEVSNENALKTLNTDEILKDYFRLDFDLQKHYKSWSSKDIYFKEAAEQFYGIRILKQEVVENIFSFICSSNNNIARISSMVEKLAKFYGNKICEIDKIEYYSFPTVEALSVDGVENKLRENGFGYRAKYISDSAKAIVAAGGSKWLKELKEMDYKDAKNRLISLKGVGAKVKKSYTIYTLNYILIKYVCLVKYLQFIYFRLLIVFVSCLLAIYNQYRLTHTYIR